MVDILFLAHNRPEFTRASLKALVQNTDLKSNRLTIYTDGDNSVENIDVIKECAIEVVSSVDMARLGGPVACLVDGLQKTANAPGAAQDSHAEGQFIAKIDNDTVVPPGWLEACLDVMQRFPEVDLLGIEPWAPDPSVFPHWIEPMPTPFSYTVRLTSHVGGIGLFRRSAFERFGLPKPNTQDGRYGFTEWQWSDGGQRGVGTRRKQMVKAFIAPPLPVFLLDHLPLEPWRTINRMYDATGVQRRVWGEYPAECSELWNWWVASGETKREPGAPLEVPGE